MTAVDGSLAAWLKAEALYAVTTPPGVAWTPDQAVDVQFQTPYDTRVDALAEAARSAAVFGGPNVKDRVVVKGRRRDLLFKCIYIKGDRLGYGEGFNLLTNGDFTVNANGWSPNGTGDPTLAAVGGRLRVTSVAAAARYGYQSVANLLVGQSYRARGEVYDGTGAGFINLGTSSGGAQYAQQSSAAKLDVTFVASAGSVYFSLWQNTGVAGNYSEFDNLSLVRLGAPAFVIGVAENDNNTTVLTVIRRLGS